MGKILGLQPNINNVSVTVNNIPRHDSFESTTIFWNNLKIRSRIIVIGRLIYLEPDAEGDLVFFSEEQLLHETHLELDFEVRSEHSLSFFFVGYILGSLFRILLRDLTIAQKLRVLSSRVDETYTFVLAIKRCELW